MDEYTLLESLDTDQLVAIRDADADQLTTGDKPYFIQEAIRDRLQMIDLELAKRAQEQVA